MWTWSNCGSKCKKMINLWISLFLVHKSTRVERNRSVSAQTGQKLRGRGIRRVEFYGFTPCARGLWVLAGLILLASQLKGTGACFGAVFWAKMRPFSAKTGPLGLKKGQNRGFSVTDSSTGQKCKLLITCTLQAMRGSKDGLHRVGGGGTPLSGTRD